MLLTTFIGKDPVTKNYDENVKKSAIAYKRRNGVKLQQTDNLLVLENRRDGKVLSWMAVFDDIELFAGRDGFACPEIRFIDRHHGNLEDLRPGSILIPGKPK